MDHTVDSIYWLQFRGAAGNEIVWCKLCGQEIMHRLPRGGWGPPVMQSHLNGKLHGYNWELARLAGETA